MRIAPTLFLPVSFAALLAATGCSFWRKDRGAEITYEQTRRQIEGSNSSDSAHPTSLNRRVSYAGEVAPEDDGLGLSDLNPNRLNKTVKTLVGQGPKHEVAIRLLEQGRTEFDEAVALRKKGQDAKAAFAKAAETFEEAAGRWEDSSLEQDALFMAGESYFFAENYTEANDVYQRLIKKYPKTHHLDRIEPKRFSIAQYWLKMHEDDPQQFYEWNLTDDRLPTRGAFTNAVKVLDSIRMDDPTGKFADDATMAAGTAHFRAGNWVEAADFFEDLRRTFPNSEHQFRAHFLELKCRLESYDGEEYSAVALNKADKLLGTLQKQFPNQIQEHAVELGEAASEIKNLMAAREMKMAKYFDRRGEYGGAKYYYRILADDYADTRDGQAAIERLREIADKPDKPPQRLSWLVDLFPNPEPAKPLIAPDVMKR